MAGTSGSIVGCKCPCLLVVGFLNLVPSPGGDDGRIHSGLVSRLVKAPGD